MLAQCPALKEESKQWNSKKPSFQQNLLYILCEYEFCVLIVCSENDGMRGKENIGYLLVSLIFGLQLIISKLKVENLINICIHIKIK